MCKCYRNRLLIIKINSSIASELNDSNQLCDIIKVYYGKNLIYSNVNANYNKKTYLNHSFIKQFSNFTI